MEALGILLVVALAIGVAAVLLKILIALVVLPFKLGFALIKVSAAILIGIPLVILMALAAVALLPLLALALPVLVIGVVLIPFFLIAKAIF